MARPRKNAAVAAAEEKKAEAKTTVKKTPAKKSAVYVQYAGLEVNIEQITKAAKDAWGGKKSDITSFDLYVKPEENAAYYVINGTDTGSVSLS